MDIQFENLRGEHLIFQTGIRHAKPEPTTTDEEPITPITSHRCRILPISLCSRIFRRTVGPTISRSLGFQALPTSFGQSVQHLNAASLIHRTNQFRPKFIAHSGANRQECMLDDHQATLDAVLRGRGWFYEPAGQVGGRARRHSLWTSQPSTTSTNAMIPVG